MTKASGMTGKFSTIPARTSAKLPEEYLERRVCETRPGEHFVVEAEALIVDPEMNCWLNPDAIIHTGTTSLLNSSAPSLLVTREAQGYVVSLQSIKGHHWRAKPKPESVNGTDWIPVAELKY
ncbi:MAG: hypothetical protein P4L84_19795 [Isosphaeraceae bacterium]|nr:hypothetical protein [Isosphaeraceae bacterium]